LKTVRTVIFAEGSFADDIHCKTGYGVLRYAPDTVVAVIDSQLAGRDAYEISRLGRGIPVVSDLTSALRFEPNRLLIGVAPAGGALPESWRQEILFALRKGLEVLNGLHTILSEDKEFVEAAETGGARIIDLRKEPDDLDVALCRAQRVEANVVLTVGTDCACGKMTTALEMLYEARRRGIPSDFCATGQTGIAIAGWGISVDHVLSDFTAGAAERLVLEAGADKNVKLILVEGQGALAQPVYSGVMLSLMHGSLPDNMILCHQANQQLVELVDRPMPPLAEHISLYEESMRIIKPAKVRAISLKTRGMDENEARRVIEETAIEAGLPVTDPVRFGSGVLLDAVLNDCPQKVPLSGEMAHIDLNPPF